METSETAHLELTGIDPTSACFIEYWANGGKSAANHFQRDKATRGDLQHLQIAVHGNYKMEVLIYGHGTPIAFVSGLGMTTPAWYYQLRDLSDHFTIIIIHKPGHGDSELTGNLSYKSIGRAVASVLKALPITGPIHLVGTCAGGVVALHTAAQAFSPIASVTLVNTIGANNIAASHMSKLSRDGVKEIMRYLTEFNTNLDNDFKTITDGLHLAQTDLELKYNIYNKSKVMHPAAYAQYMLSNYEDKNNYELSNQLNMPLHLLVGEKDSAVDNGNSLALYDTLNASSYTVIPGAGHFPYITHPDLFDSFLLKNFLNT